MPDAMKLARYALAGWLPGGKCHCVICDSRIWRFMPYRTGRSVPLLEALQAVGSDVLNFECPRCGSTDRERHLFLYFRACGLLKSMGSRRILHFAPEKHLSRLIHGLSPTRYVKCDLQPAAGDVQRVDMQQIPFEDSSFDLVIANHVLEHVDDDRAALAEVFRVLQPGGFAVLQTPYSAILEETWSDPGIVSAHARLQAYGQEDHVRLFGKDMVGRFSESGLRQRVQSHEELLPGVDGCRVGVNREEPFLLFQRC